jgi:two-component system phosphate regulon sensor histidine kinase PhoR
LLNTFEPANLQQDLYLQALSNLPHGIILIDIDYRVVFANEKCQELTEGERNVIGQFVWEVFPVLNQAPLKQALDRTFDTKEVQTIPGFPLQKGEGEQLFLDIVINCAAKGAESEYYMVTFYDVTEHHLIWKSKTEDCMRIKHILDNIGGPLMIFEQKGQLVFANEILYSLQSIAFQTIEELNQFYDFYDFKGRGLEQRQLPFYRALDGEYVHNFELKLCDKETRFNHYYLITTRPIQFQGDEQRYIVVLMVDVTNDLKEQQVRSEFIQIAAHELRTPLTSIKGFTQLVLERYKEREKKWFFQPTMNLYREIERDQTFFKVILDETIRLDELTTELLSIFKIDHGKFELDLHKIELSSIVQEALKEYLIPNDFHKIYYQDLTNSSHVIADSKQIKRVIHNLLSNAIKYSPASSDIHVTLEQKEEIVYFSVKDEGIGIPEDQQYRIFERFYRAQSSMHDEIQGFGVGLHICQEIIVHHEGDIGFKSKYGQGSTFFFQLPIRKKRIVTESL